MQERDNRKRERESKTLLRFAAQPDRQPRLPTWVPLSLYLPWSAAFADRVPKTSLLKSRSIILKIYFDIIAKMHFFLLLYV